MTTEFINTSTIRDNVLKNVSILLGLFVLVVASINMFLTYNYILGAIELVISMTFFQIYYKVRNYQSLAWQPAFVASLITVGLLYGFYHTKPSSAIVMWVYVLPPLYQLMFNRVIGSVATFAMLVATSIIYFPGLFNDDVYPFSFINFAIPYTMIWAIAYNHEIVRVGVQKRLEQMARTDSLTGAFNHLALYQDTSSKLHFCAVSHLLHFDLDWFKKINDTYGHSVGDEVLKTIVQRVQSTLTNSRIYRIGGEEFCVIFCANDMTEAKQMSETLRESIESLVFEPDIRVTISGGLIALPNECKNEDLDLALKSTDRALYRAKASGRNVIYAAETSLL
ncbi:GGDEF domain-containing protein [Vibrio aquaticus]|uniref:diguanylate cyclase n=1 Tax=Vibrio aquaticus TaxID=2496559 RepID=A0A432CYN5_9VIBR|nr:GGDEF domain-containing protein [Vibrio aquaticus]RTZ16516.1 GGDEF domain-containing protein [Vibrio aquaticus]